MHLGLRVWGRDSSKGAMALRAVIWQSRRLIGLYALALGCSFVLILERQIREHLAFRDHPLFRELVDEVPNFRHVWFAWNLADTNSYLEWLFGKETRYPVNGFGSHALKTNGSWKELCALDSDGDNLTNGVELGDPCCRWKSGPVADGYFEIGHNLEYRRWMISHPSHPTVRNDLVHSFPKSCTEDYDAEQYQRVYRDFYFSRLNEPKEDVPWSFVKMAAFAFMTFQLGYSFAFEGLKDDLFSRTSPLSIGLRVSLIAVSFVYFDMTSGVIHVILDNAPAFLPVLGGLAGGFRYHHEDPTAICRISWFEYASHVHLLAVIVLFGMRLSPHSRGLRFFWVWGLVWCHLFQSAHRWSHFPADQLPVWITALQGGLVLSHERHMEHHQDAGKQFTILSGRTDWILDAFVKLMPAQYYDYWCVFGVVWFFLPVLVDLWLLSREIVLPFTSGSGKVADKV